MKAFTVETTNVCTAKSSRCLVIVRIASYSCIDDHFKWIKLLTSNWSPLKLNIYSKI